MMFQVIYQSFVYQPFEYLGNCTKNSDRSVLRIKGDILSHPVAAFDPGDLIIRVTSSGSVLFRTKDDAFLV